MGLRDVTGIEISATSCVLARVGPGPGGPRVSRVHLLEPDAASGPEERAGILRRVRRGQRFPRHARVVAWGVPDGSASDDPAPIAAVAPLRDAGFIVDCVLSPAEALALLDSQRRSAAGRGAAAWAALNRDGLALAIVERGRILYSRVLDWTWRRTGSTREELLQRYLLVSHVAPALQRGIDVVRKEHGTTIDAIITCGNLPDLRSLTMPLIEELDADVETLDSLEGLEIAGGVSLARLHEKAPALRLAVAAAADPVLRRQARVERGAWLTAAAAAAALVVAAWGIWQWRGSPAADLILPVDRAVPAERQAGGDDPVPAATTGQESEADPLPAGSGAPEPIRPAPVPQLPPPLPRVNSILVAPDRRVAVLDGEIVREGDRINAREVVEIEPYAVILREPSGRLVRVTFGPRAAPATRR